MCENKLGWDDELSQELRHQWESLRNDLHHLRDICVPRCYFSNQGREKIELHGFCDASGRAYAAAVYARVTYTNNVDIVLVSSKSSGTHEDPDYSPSGVVGSSDLNTPHESSL